MCGMPRSGELATENYRGVWSFLLLLLLFFLRSGCLGVPWGYSALIEEG